MRLRYLAFVLILRSAHLDQPNSYTGIDFIYWILFDSSSGIPSISDPDPSVRIRIGLFFPSPDQDRQKSGSDSENTEPDPWKL